MAQKGTAGIHGHIHCTTTNIDHTDAQFTFIFGQHGIACRQTGENKLVNNFRPQRSTAFTMSSSPYR